MAENPAPPPERTLTRGCGAGRECGVDHGYGECFWPKPTDAETIAALREEVERLRERARNHVQDMNILQMKCDYVLAARNQENALFLAEKARVAALTAALREIADDTTDAKAWTVARAALARIEEKK